MNICENRCIHTCNPETSQVIYASHPTYPPLQKGCTSWVKKKCLPTYTPTTYPQCGGTAPLPCAWSMYHCTRPRRVRNPVHDAAASSSIRLSIMRCHWLPLLLFSLAIIRAATAPLLGPATRLLVEYMPSPTAGAAAPSSSPLVTVSEVRPRFSWHTAAVARGISQAAYRVVVHCNETGAVQPQLMWDSGRVESNGSTNVALGGEALLQAGSSCDWRIQWWATDGQAAPTTAPHKFDVGPLALADWAGAVWIGGESGRQLRVELPVLAGDVCRGRLYYAAPGGAAVTLNGGAVGEQNGIGPWTNARKRVLYLTHDITAQLNAAASDAHATTARWWGSPRSPPPREETQTGGGGGHVLGIMLGHGMWGNYHLTAEPGPPVIKLKIMIELCAAPTKPIVVVSDGGDAWRCTAGPILSLTSPPQIMKGGSGNNSWERHWVERLSDDPFRGTVTDFRLLQQGWDTPGFPNASRWPRCPPVSGGPEGDIAALMLPQTTTVRVVRPRSPVLGVALPDEYGGPVRMVDFGENLVGVTRLHVHGPVGSSVTVRHAETLLLNQSLNINWTCGVGPCGCGCCARDATCVGVKAEFQRDRYDLRGTGSTEVLLPQFTWHGFRFATIELSQGVTLEAVEALVFQTPVESVGLLAFGDDAASAGAGAQLQRVHNMVLRTRQSNLVQYSPTDCPTRESELDNTSPFNNHR